jgi:hypothetical protein
LPRITVCRSCNSPDLSLVLDLGRQPIANALREPDEAEKPENTFPLEVVFCRQCTLLQVTETVPAEVLFGCNYPYYSSFSPFLLKHSRDHALRLVEELDLGPGQLVVEVAGNDGYLLKNFVELGIPVLNIDPASGPAAAAEAEGVSTLNDYFGSVLAKKLVSEGKKADVIIANNVAAHVDGINDFIAGFSLLLADEGIIEIEVAYVLDLITSNAFDTIYHEHLFYYSLTALEALVERHGLHLNDVQRISIHGGSIRARISKRAGSTERLQALRAQEFALGMHTHNFYANFATHVAGVREKLQILLSDLKAQGARIAAYGAAAKGATLLNYAGLDCRTIDYVVDRNVHKVWKLMPGARIPIRAVDHILEDRPDYVLLLAWNFAGEIMTQQAEYLQLGGAFIIPVPEPHIAS